VRGDACLHTERDAAQSIFRPSAFWLLRSLAGTMWKKVGMITVQVLHVACEFHLMHTSRACASGPVQAFPGVSYATPQSGSLPVRAFNGGVCCPQQAASGQGQATKQHEGQPRRMAVREAHAKRRCQRGLQLGQQPTSRCFAARCERCMQRSQPLQRLGAGCFCTWVPMAPEMARLRPQMQDLPRR
jgi:hypothetical protein